MLPLCAAADMAAGPWTDLVDATEQVGGGEQFSAVGTFDTLATAAAQHAFMAAGLATAS